MKFARTPPFKTEALRSLAAKVRVRRDARLESQYPELWPARVVVERSGKRKSIVVDTPAWGCAESDGVERRVVEGLTSPRAADGVPGSEIARTNSSRDS